MCSQKTNAYGLLTVIAEGRALDPNLAKFLLNCGHKPP